MAFRVLVAVALAFVTLPLLALVLRSPWKEAVALLAVPQVGQAVRLSLAASLAATALATLLGVPLAWALARSRIPGRSLVRAVATLPMVLPPVVAGVALLLAFGRQGLLGGALAAFGVSVPFTTAAVVLAAAFVSMPFLVVTLEGALRSADRGLEEAAATLGASRLYVLRRVTLPAVMPAAGAGLALTWARALGEFGATITFAGNLPGRTQTLPLAVFLSLETRPQAAYLLSVLLMAVSVVVLLAARRRLWGGE